MQHVVLMYYEHEGSGFESGWMATNPQLNYFHLFSTWQMVSVQPKMWIYDGKVELLLLIINFRIMIIVKFSALSCIWLKISIH